MTVDQSCVFSSAQAIGGGGADATIQSTDWVDFGVAQNLGDGHPPVVEIVCTTTVAGGTSVQFQLCACEADGSNPVVIDTTPAIAVASLVAAGAGVGNSTGFRTILRLSPQRALPAVSGSDPRSALRLQYVTAGTVTAGAFTAHLTPEAASEFGGKAYPLAW